MGSFAQHRMNLGAKASGQRHRLVINSSREEAAVGSPHPALRRLASLTLQQRCEHTPSRCGVLPRAAEAS